MVGDVLDLEGAGAGVGLLELRQHLGERLAGRVNPQQAGRDSCLKLRRQPGLQSFRLESRIADRLASKGIEARGQVAVRT